MFYVRKFIRSTWSGSAWFIFGTGIGESITRSTRSGGAWGLRYHRLTKDRKNHCQFWQ